MKTSLRMARPELDIMWLLHKCSVQNLWYSWQMVQSQQMQYSIIIKVYFCRSSVSIWPVTCASGRLGARLLCTKSENSLMGEANQTTCWKLKDDLQVFFYVCYLTRLSTAKIIALGGKPVPIPLRPPQIPHGLARYRNQASVVKEHQLTDWAIAQPSVTYHTDVLTRQITPNILSQHLL